MSDQAQSGPNASQPEPALTEVTMVMQASADRIFAELSDGWTYVGWVVGGVHIRDVEDGWPAVGTKIHHKIGAWPLAVADDTESLEVEPGRRLKLRARGWPLGEATVELVLEPQDADRTLVRIREAPVAGPARQLDNPVLRWALKARNVETLRRLRDRVENRTLRPSG